MIRSTRSLLLGLFAVSLAASVVAAAPNPPIGPVQNFDLYNGVSPAAPMITNTGQAATTKTATPPVANTQWRGVVCVSAWTASSGSPTEVLNIQGFDAATNSFYTIASSASITSGGGTVTAYPGVATSSLSSGNAAQSAVLPRVWRLQEVIAGTGGPTITNKVGCNYIVP